MDYALWGVGEAQAHQDALWSVYEVVCAQHRDQMVWHESMLGKHMRRARFRLAVALDDDDRIVAFSWGYTGYRGQWWSDRVAEVLGPVEGDHWVGGHFELVEIAVPDQGERQVIVKRLHDRLLRGLAEPRALISVDDDDLLVRDLLERRGWHSIGALTRGWTIYGVLLREGAQASGALF